MLLKVEAVSCFIHNVFTEYRIMIIKSKNYLSTRRLVIMNPITSSSTENLDSFLLSLNNLEALPYALAERRQEIARLEGLRRQFVQIPAIMQDPRFRELSTRFQNFSNRYKLKTVPDLKLEQLLERGYQHIYHPSSLFNALQGRVGDIYNNQGQRLPHAGDSFQKGFSDLFWCDCPVASNELRIEALNKLAKATAEKFASDELLRIYEIGSCNLLFSLLLLERLQAYGFEKFELHYFDLLYPKSICGEYQLREDGFTRIALEDSAYDITLTNSRGTNADETDKLINSVKAFCNQLAHFSSKNPKLTYTLSFAQTIDHYVTHQNSDSSTKNSLFVLVDPNDTRYSVPDYRLANMIGAGAATAYVPKGGNLDNFYLFLSEEEPPTLFAREDLWESLRARQFPEGAEDLLEVCAMIKNNLSSHEIREQIKEQIPDIHWLNNAFFTLRRLALKIAPSSKDKIICTLAREVFLSNDVYDNDRLFGDNTSFGKRLVSEYIRLNLRA